MSIMRLVSFSFEQRSLDASAHVADSGTRSACHIFTTRVCTLCTALCSLIDIATIRADTASCFDNPACNGRNAEVTHDTDKEEDDVLPRPRIRQVVGVTERFDVLLYHQHLYLRKQCRKDRADRQPQVYRDIA